MKADGNGYFVGIEIKNELTKDKIKKHQDEFHKRILEAGGVVYVVRSYQEFLDWYKLSGF